MVFLGLLDVLANGLCLVSGQREHQRVVLDGYHSLHQSLPHKAFAHQCDGQGVVHEHGWPERPVVEGGEGHALAPVQQANLPAQVLERHHDCCHNALGLEDCPSKQNSSETGRLAKSLGSSRSKRIAEPSFMNDWSPSWLLLPSGPISKEPLRKASQRGVIIKALDSSYPVAFLRQSEYVVLSRERTNWLKAGGHFIAGVHLRLVRGVEAITISGAPRLTGHMHQTQDE